MKQSDPLALVDAGTLPKPGPMGRLLRLALGSACLYANYDLVTLREQIIETPVQILPGLAILILVGICVFNYVVNIGFGRNWRTWPSIVAIGVLMSLAAVSWMAFGTANHWLPGSVLWLWLTYLFAHLGTSFVLAAIVGTPGCEMRAIPEAFGKLRGHPTSEHPCPATFITRLDEWERNR